uniref:Uncharacterized protein n=1 Tax=Oryza sativa subsp. japonica TaxID=39947 RepID=Q6H7M6_ORYSJ|nr:hypothetical protein [Oryza sativa Japonica Group]BAD25273.1 hypothetical protein [Oryza sativa Japonica Group]
MGDAEEEEAAAEEGEGNGDLGVARLEDKRGGGNGGRGIIGQGHRRGPGDVRVEERQGPTWVTLCADQAVEVVGGEGLGPSCRREDGR